MESVTLTREDREKLCAHVEAADGWPAGFGILGSRIKHEAPEENRLCPLTLSADELGDAWPKLLALVTAAGIGATPEPEPETKAALAPAESFPTLTLDSPPRTVSDEEPRAEKRSRR